MDKLEIDTRVVRLERSVGWLSAVVLGFLALVGVGLLLMLSGSRPRTGHDLADGSFPGHDPAHGFSGEPSADEPISVGPLRSAIGVGQP